MTDTTTVHSVIFDSTANMIADAITAEGQAANWQAQIDDLSARRDAALNRAGMLRQAAAQVSAAFP